MGFEEFPSHPKEERRKEKTKTTLYKPFDKKEKRKGNYGVQIDAEEKIILEGIEEKLNNINKKNEKLLERFKEIERDLIPNKLWAKTEVSGEEHTVVFMGLERQASAIPVSEVTKQVEKKQGIPEQTIARFRLKKTSGRPEHLFLSFKTPLTTLLRGGGRIEQELAKLITQQFAGTKHYYQTLRQGQKEQIQPPQNNETFKETKNQIKGMLQKNGAEISEVEAGEKGSFLLSFIAFFPDTKKQVHIATIDKKNWNVVEIEDQKIKKELFNLRPQEVISSVIERVK